MQFSSEVPQVPGVLHLNPVFISAENPPPSSFCTFQRKHEPLICIIQNVPCVLHVCASVRVRLGMRIDLFSAFPNLIIHTGLGTGPTQWAREKKLVTDENGTDKNQGDLQRKKWERTEYKEYTSSPELGHCFFCPKRTQTDKLGPYDVQFWENWKTHIFWLHLIKPVA